MAPFYVPQDAPQGPYPYPFTGGSQQQPPQQVDPRRLRRPVDPGALSGFASDAAGTGFYPVPESRAARPQPVPRRQADHPGASGSYSARMPAARPARTDPTLYEWDRLSPEQQQAVLETIGGARAANGRSMRRTALVIALVIVLALALLATLVVAVLLSRGRVLG